MSVFCRLARYNPISDWSSDAGRKSNADLVVALMAAALPWSTTAFGILTVLWLVTVVPIIDIRQFLQLIKRRPWALSIGLFGLAIAGMFWASVSWSMRIYTVGTMIKLMALPLLVHQFQRSEHGHKVLCVFYASCIVLLSISWLHRLGLFTAPFSTRVPGVPVKNWITQGTEFTLCIFGSAALSVIMWRKRNIRASVGFALIGFAFMLNMAFVPSSRTSLVSLLVLLPVLTYRYIGWRSSLALYVLLVLIGLAFWLASSNFRERLESIPEQLVWYEKGTVEASVGLRLEYWTKSIKFIGEAPIIGHGTGSIRALFESEAHNPTSKNEIVANPHNQTLYFAIQWGVIGVFLLYAMWMSHFLLFTASRWMAWFGTLIVSQNIFGSLFNSHLSDYVEGWIYVMGVGICAGTISKWSAEPQPSIQEEVV